MAFLDIVHESSHFCGCGGVIFYLLFPEINIIPLQANHPTAIGKIRLKPIGKPYCMTHTTSHLGMYEVTLCENHKGGRISTSRER